MFYDTLYHALGDVEEPLRLMIGLPVEVMADKQLARDTLRVLKSWLVGEHTFEIDDEDEPVSLSVERIRAMAQPAGAFFAWGLNDHGKWARDTSDLEAPVAVCDIGFNTLDLFAVQGGEIMARFTGGDTAGMRRAAEVLIGAVGAYDVELSLHEADALLRQRRPKLYTSLGEIDLWPQVKQALDTAAAGITTFVERQWGKGKQFAHLLFTGAEALRGALLRQYPHGIVLPNAVAANAIGLARYAARVFGE